jgi:hypothetical protein
MTSVKVAIRTLPVVFSEAVIMSLSLDLDEVVAETEHQVWLEDTAHLLPFMVIVNVSLPPLPVNFNESEDALNTGSVTVDEGLAGSFPLQAVESIAKNIVKMNIRLYFFILELNFVIFKYLSCDLEKIPRLI